MEQMIEYLERYIKNCDDLGGLEKEKWAFQQCLKEARNIVGEDEKENAYWRKQADEQEMEGSYHELPE